MGCWGCAHSCSAPSNLQRSPKGEGWGHQFWWVHPNSLPGVGVGECHGPPTLWDCIPSLFHPNSHSPIAFPTPGVVVSAFCKGMSHLVPSPCWGCPPGGMRGMWGGLFCRVPGCLPHRIKGTVFSKGFPKVGSCALEVASSCPLGLGATRSWDLGLCGVSRGLRWGMAVGWRSLNPELVAGMEWLGWSPAAPRWCHGGEELLAPALPSLPPSLIPPALLSSLHPSLCPSLHPFSVVLPAQDVAASLSLACCQPFPTLPNPGLQPWLLMPWEQLLKSPRARETGPGP